jgi:hypothetical protein
MTNGNLHAPAQCLPERRHPAALPGGSLLRLGQPLLHRRHLGCQRVLLRARGLGPALRRRIGVLRARLRLPALGEAATGLLGPLVQRACPKRRCYSGIAYIMIRTPYPIYILCLWI